MSPRLAALAGCAIVAAACSTTPASPSAVSTARAARLSRTRFIAFGDSITSGEITAPIGAGGYIGKLVVIPSVSYPAVLQSQLQASYPAQASVISVINEGKSGENIVDGVLRFEDVLAANSSATVVIIDEGINSLGFPGVLPATNLTGDMVRLAKARNLKVFVASLLPSPPGRQRSQSAAALETYNELLKIKCAAEGATYVDLYSGLLPQADTLIGVDGLHPTEAGYRRIAELFFAAIKSELEEK